MGRPFIQRLVGCRPGAMVFRPAGIAAGALRTAAVALDEFEALRLVDAEGLEQVEAAHHMRVSRATVGRILQRGRRKVALALVRGEALVIAPGPAPVQFDRPSLSGDSRKRKHRQRKGAKHG
ncbi:MAG: DUF134 domain-containing protein [Kiritimatiellae bacterium]|nr:DUF134 domain-containing protein [Kiritimatiellia bacterium]